MNDPIALTQTVKKGGCAAKLPAKQLQEVLSGLQMFNPKELVVGSDSFDDACLWDMPGPEYLVKTLDFFTPIVDDAYDFGAIAAANALSDIYAMGGQPFLALSILAFPAKDLPISLLKPLMQGAIDKLTEANVALGGGHTIDDDSLKLGFSITGLVAKSKVWTNATTQEGDVLLLTKGLGTGTITSALKLHKAEPNWIAAATDSMKKLNKVNGLFNNITVHAATDVTGFGLGGHAMQMAKASRKTFYIDVKKLPALIGARELINNEVLNRAHYTNKDYIKDHIDLKSHVSVTDQWLICDPQTSGGLLLAVAEREAQQVIASLTATFPAVTQIGRVGPLSDKFLVFG